MSDRRQDTTLVVSGTGKTGRRVTERLIARGVPVRAASRSGATGFDWEDPATWGPALDGAAAAYVAFSPDLAVPGAPEAIRELTAQARERGVRRLVLLSGRGEEEAQRSERMLAEAGGEWTVVRASWFQQNFSEGAFLDAVLGGDLALPVGDVGEPFVDVEDVADVAVEALLGDGHAGQVYEVTGPRLLTFADAVDEIRRATGRKLRFIEVPLERFAAALGDEGVPADAIALLRYLFTEVLDGRNATVTDGVQRALGRPPRDFADYARRTAATGVWG